MRKSQWSMDGDKPMLIFDDPKAAPYYEDEIKAHWDAWKKIREESGPRRFDSKGGNTPWKRKWTYEDLSLKQQREGWSVQNHVVHGPEGNPRCSAAIQPSIKAGKPMPCCNWPWECSLENPRGRNGRCMKHGGNTPRGAGSSWVTRRIDINGKPSELVAKARQEAEAEQEEINGYIEKWGVAVVGGDIIPIEKAPLATAPRQKRYRIPASLVDAYERQVQIEDYLSGKDDIAIIAARVEALLDTIRDGGSPETWRSLNETAIAANRAKREGNEKDYNDAISTMFILIAEGHNENKTYDKIIEVMEANRKLKETEIKRITAAQNSVQKEDVLGLFKWYQETVVNESDAISDPVERKAFLTRIQRAVDLKFRGQ